MKLLIFIHSLGGGGAERVTVTLANHWVTLGWDVTIVTVATRDADQYELHPAVTRATLDQASGAPNFLAALIANAGRVRKLRRLLRREQPQVAISMMTIANILLALAAFGLKRPATIGCERVHPPQYPLGRVWGSLRAVCYRFLDTVVAQTKVTEEWLTRHTWAQRVVVIPNPVVWPLQPALPALPPASVGQPSRKRLLAVGRLDYQKGFDLLLDAFAIVAPVCPDWELVVLGDGRLRGILEGQLTALNLRGRAFLPGRAGNVGDWYASADLFVLSSRFEGFPNALLEAMASGLPAVSLDCETGPSEIIEAGVSGLLVPLKGANVTLPIALDRLMQDSALREQFASRAIEVRARFGLSATMMLWAKLFAELMPEDSGSCTPAIQA